MHTLKRNNKDGFTLVELLVVMAIMVILVGIVIFNFQDAKKKSRDKIRQADLQSLQLAIEVYKSQNGRYPAMGCGAPTGGGGHAWSGEFQWAVGWQYGCTDYISGLVPNYLPSLPKDSIAAVDGKGFIYSTNTTGTAYKLFSHGSAEALFIQSYQDEFARCPAPCAGHTTADLCRPVGPPTTLYAVYSAGAECW